MNLRSKGSQVDWFEVQSNYWSILYRHGGRAQCSIFTAIVLIHAEEPWHPDEIEISYNLYNQLQNYKSHIVLAFN